MRFRAVVAVTALVLSTAAPPVGEVCGWRVEA
jgi:hypothetical protein